MQSNIPQYILERGASAREYRRRSSCMSRSSNSSMNQICTQKEGNVASPRTSSGFGDESLADNDELVNYKLGSALPYQQQMQAQPSMLSEHEGSTSGGMTIPPNSYMHPLEQDAREAMRSSGSSEFGSDFGYDSPRHMYSSNASGNTDPGRMQQPQQSQRFGMARPRLIYF
ncbi:hypothetical protein H4R99_001888 [Coemansia sp. RSA 1722]|nr:hypothetical protein IWW45_003741 [Coemansia sp. RSA 485]KAJ2604330.1 hypothetical protein H4R99_001888 [Coemansia sp. RSA 1722]